MGLRLRLMKRPFAEYDLCALTKTPARHRERSGESGGLVRPCSSEKLLNHELETYPVPNTCYVIYGQALTIRERGQISSNCWFPYPLMMRSGLFLGTVLPEHLDNAVYQS
jgi:hypothetical protein